MIAFAACSGTVDPEDEIPQEQIPEEFTEPFTLSADKTEVEASGKDVVTFSLKDAYGREMLDDKNILQGVWMSSCSISLSSNSPPVSFARTIASDFAKDAVRILTKESATAPKRR